MVLGGKQNHRYCLKELFYSAPVILKYENDYASAFDV